MSILTSTMIAAILDLPIDKNLGFAWLVLFKDCKHSNQQRLPFQLDYKGKGYIQLSLRTGQYVHINALEVYDVEIRNLDKFTEGYDRGERLSDEIVGSLGYLKWSMALKRLFIGLKTK